MDIQPLVEKVRETLKTEEDYYLWKTDGAWRNIVVCKAIDEDAFFHEISTQDINRVIHAVSELVRNN